MDTSMDKISITPLADRVVIKRIDGESMTKSGLYIPDQAKTKPLEGIVMAAGVDVHLVQVGDRIMFEKYSGTSITVDNVDYLIMREEDLLAVVS